MAEVDSTRVRLNASPSKRVLLNAARAYSPDIAVAELIDNAVDVWRDQETVNDLHVDIRFDFEADRLVRIRVHDDGGGVPVERLEALVKAGVENPNDRAIGVWGQGLKIACIVLAETAVMRTRFREGPAYRIEWSKDWWATDDWALWADVEPNSALAPGTFEVQLTNLKTPLRHAEVFIDADVESLKTRLARIYAPLLSEASTSRLRLTLYDGERAVEVTAAEYGDPAKFAFLFAHPPGFAPTIHTRTFHVRDAAGSRKLAAKAVVGLLPEQSRDLSGVTMYGKGRLFVQALKEGTVGFGTRGAAMIPASHPTTWRLLVLIYFDGDSELIPWKAPTKEGYAENNRFYKEIRSFIAGIATPYAAFTKVAKRLDVLPYSRVWSEMPVEDVRKEILQYCRDDSLVPKFVEANPQLGGTYQVAPLVEVNHDRISTGTSLMPGKSATTGMPALSSEASRAVALTLGKRDVRDPKSLWSPEALLQSKEPEPAPADGTVTPRTELLRTAQLAEAWKEPRPVTIRMPRALYELVESAALGSMNDWILHAVEQRVGRDVDPLLRIPPASSTFRPVVQEIRREILDEFPDVEAIALFGSVARGTADRESDIDLLVVHADRNRLQRGLNELFRDFRFPSIHGNRYAVRSQVSSPDGMRALQESQDAKTAQMMREAIWLHGAARYGKQ